MKFAYLLSASLLVATPAMAQVENGDDGTNDIVGVIAEQPKLPTDDSITVTATGLQELIARSGQSISVITADQIETVQGPDTARLLERLPGVVISRNGPLGSATSLFVRGANSQQTLVMIDGIRLNDLAAPSGGFDLGTVVNGGIGRVELLRGSNSLAWGSDAIGGVLAFSSDDRPGLRAGVEYGANETFSGNAGWTTRGANHMLSLNGGYVESNGISAYSGGTEPDGFRQWNVGGKGELGLTGNLRMVVAGRYADSRIDFDGFQSVPPYAFIDTPEYQTTKQASGRAGLEYGTAGLDLAAGVAISDTKRSYFDPTYGTASNFDTAGQGIHADLKGRVDLQGGFALVFGADADWSEFSTSFDPRQTARMIGGHALLSYDNDGRLSLTFGGRVDDHDRFGSHTTLGANGSFQLADNWRVRASWGQGFKAPTLSQLYGYGGNASLQPETSDAIDLGIEYDNGGSDRFAVTLFRRDTRNQIDYVWPTGYFNIGRARAQGIEVEGAVTVADSITLSGNYTYLDATNRLTGNELARRPRHALNLSVDWRSPVSGLKLGADFRLVGDRFDDGGNFVPLDGYGLVTLRASAPIGDKVELYGRVENVTDQQYETAAGYGSYGRSAFVGARLKW